MTEAEFKSLLGPDEYQVILFASRMSWPFVFARHTWFVVVRGGEAHRWDVWAYKNRCATSWGHVHRDLYPPWLGVRRFPSPDSSQGAARFAGQLIASVSGGAGSAAEKLARFIEEESPRYPFADSYRLLPGPNSNTYTRWVLDRCPTDGFALPWGSFGQGFAARLGRAE